MYNITIYNIVILYMYIIYIYIYISELKDKEQSSRYVAVV